MPASKDLLAQVRKAWNASKDAVLKAATPEGADAPDRDVLAEAFEEEFGDIHHAIHESAFNAGRTREGDRLKKAEAKAKDLAEQLDARDKELADVQSKAPDADKLKKSFEQQLAKADEKAREQIESLSGQLSTMRQDRDLGAFEKDLIDAGLKPRAAASYRAIHAKHFEYDDEGKPVVKHPESGVPFIVAKGAPWSPLVKQIREKADPDDVKVAMDQNGGGVIRRGYGNGNAALPIGTASEQALAKKVQRDGRGFSGL